MECNEELRQLHRLLQRKTELEEMRVTLREKQRKLAPELKERKRSARAEQRDVDRLERPSITALVYHATGKLEQQLASERAEAKAAQEEYASAVRKMEDIESQLQDTEMQLTALETGQQRYEQLLEQKRNAIKAAGGVDADKIKGKEQTLAFLEGQITHLKEAYATGRTARGAVNSVLSSLEHASIQNSLARERGLINDLASLSDSLPEAQSAILSLKEYITGFEAKLAMTSIRGTLNFHPEELEIWKPSLITSSLATGSKIHLAEEKLASLQQRIDRLLEQIRSEIGQINRKLQKNRDSLEKMIVNMDWPA